MIIAHFIKDFVLMLYFGREFIVFIFDIVDDIANLAESDVLVFKLVSLLLQELLVVKSFSVLEFSFFIFVSWVVSCEPCALHLAIVSTSCSCSVSSHSCWDLELKLLRWGQKRINSFYSLLFLSLRYSIINFITFLVKINQFL